MVMIYERRNKTVNEGWMAIHKKREKEKGQSEKGRVADGK